MATRTPAPLSADDVLERPGYAPGDERTTPGLIRTPFGTLAYSVGPSGALRLWPAYGIVPDPRPFRSRPFRAAEYTDELPADDPRRTDPGPIIRANPATITVHGVDYRTALRLEPTGPADARRTDAPYVLTGGADGLSPAARRTLAAYLIPAALELARPVDVARARAAHAQYARTRAAEAHAETARALAAADAELAAAGAALSLEHGRAFRRGVAL